MPDRVNVENILANYFVDFRGTLCVTEWLEETQNRKARTRMWRGWDERRYNLALPDAASSDKRKLWSILCLALIDCRNVLCSAGRVFDYERTNWIDKVVVWFSPLRFLGASVADGGWADVIKRLLQLNAGAQLGVFRVCVCAVVCDEPQGLAGELEL
ncbi:hypothetical protein HDU86_004055 [Geranomyces michiganensis]|nr:hypothetical protein HDU86_004055 [Geranomyces michiganensis]